MEVSEESVIESLREKVANQAKVIFDKEQRLNECAEEYRQLCSYQIAQLRAIQMLYDVMAAGHTHRQKEMFSQIAKETISREINNMIDRYSNSKWKFSDIKSNLPF